MQLKCLLIINDFTFSYHPAAHLAVAFGPTGSTTWITEYFNPIRRNMGTRHSLPLFCARPFCADRSDGAVASAYYTLSQRAHLVDWSIGNSDRFHAFFSNYASDRSEDSIHYAGRVFSRKCLWCVKLCRFWRPCPRVDISSGSASIAIAPAFLGLLVWVSASLSLRKI